jgi:hypothetical protein
VRSSLQEGAHLPGYVLFFPAARVRDYEDFLPVGRLTKLLADAGFANVRAASGHQIVAEDLRRFLAYASDRFRASQFMALTDTDYQAGLAAIRRVLNQADGGTVSVPSQFCLLTVTGDKSADGPI